MHAVVEVVIYNLNAKNCNGSYFLCNENLGGPSPPDDIYGSLQYVYLLSASSSVSLFAVLPL